MSEKLQKLADKILKRTAAHHAASVDLHKRSCALDAAAMAYAEAAAIEAKCEEKLGKLESHPLYDAAWTLIEEQGEQREAEYQQAIRAAFQEATGSQEPE